jgi:DNA-binding response OmpR family regulator
MLNEALARFYRFGEYEVDSARRLLFRNGERVALTPKSFDVLLALVERHGASRFSQLLSSIVLSVSGEPRPDGQELQLD